MNNTLIKKYREFRAMGVGSAIGYDAIHCLALARAEMLAEYFDITYSWEHDPDGVCMYDIPDIEKYKECLWCGVYLNDEMVANLGGILDPDLNYRRLIEAELTLEALPLTEWGKRYLLNRVA